MRTSTRWGPMAAVTGVVVAALAAAVLGGCSQDASAPVDEQQAKARSQQVIAALREAWGDDVIQWGAETRTLAHTDGDRCVIDTDVSAVLQGATDPAGMERLRPAFSTAVGRFGFPESAQVELLHGSPVLRSTHADGTVVELRGRASALQVIVPAHSSQCTSQPRLV
ncbi:MAG: hypothetical protein Q4G45_01760 [Actinomycetia bacterium]|nr:hypothetical protein [Actinomycetes bacterium]